MEWNGHKTWQLFDSERNPPPPFLKKIREKDVYLYHERGLSFKKKPWKNNKLLAVQFETGVFFSILVLIFTFLEHFNNITLWTHPAVLFSCSILTYMLVPSFQLYLLLSIYIRCCVSRLCTIYAVMNFFLSPKRRPDIEINILQTDRL